MTEGQKLLPPQAVGVFAVEMFPPLIVSRMLSAAIGTSLKPQTKASIIDIPTSLLDCVFPHLLSPFAAYRVNLVEMACNDDLAEQTPYFGVASAFEMGCA